MLLATSGVQVLLRHSICGGAYMAAVLESLSFHFLVPEGVAEGSAERGGCARVGWWVGGNSENKSRRRSFPLRPRPLPRRDQFAEPP